MSILVTISVNLAESASLRELRQFVAMAERHGADLDVDLREYDENGDLVGLAAVGQLEPTGEGRSADDDADPPCRIGTRSSRATITTGPTPGRPISEGRAGRR